MALKTVVETLDGLDEAVQGLYKESDGKYILDLDGIDDHPTVRGLKTAFEATKQDKLSAKEKLEQMEVAQAEAERKRAEESGEFKKLFESTQAELANEKETAALFRKTIHDRDISLDMMKLAADVTGDAKKQEVIVSLYKKYADVAEDGIKYSVGGVDVGRDKIIDLIKDSHPFLVDGSKASGGGAEGGGGGPINKPLAEQSEAERIEFFNRAPEEFRKAVEAQKQG